MRDCSRKQSRSEKREVIAAFYESGQKAEHSWLSSLIGPRGLREMNCWISSWSDRLVVSTHSHDLQFAVTSSPDVSKKEFQLP